jgi:anaerobic carbon-monoxide dehydrogenase iron sulfur subunit
MPKILMIHPELCTGCKICTLACSFAKEGQFRPAASRIHVYTWEREGFSVPITCLQCSNAPCVSVCPTGSIQYSPGSTRVQYNSQTCIRCRMCVEACPFGNAIYDSFTNTILRCDTCDGDPACVKFCPTNALTFEDETVSTRSRKKALAAKIKDAFQEAP